mgnify:CR=1 FL=1
MKRIESFCVNHDKLTPGMYVSRIDGDAITYDVRMVVPNAGIYLENDGIHTFEHLFATYVRNTADSDNILYVGPMGCRTGFYLLLAGDYQSRDIVPLMREMFAFIRDFEGEVPGASARDCGNYLDMNLPMAKWLADRFLREVMDNIDDSRLIYPED